MRTYNGIKQKKAILSSVNSISERIMRPATRSRMMMVEKSVDHQHTKIVGLTWPQTSGSGASE